MASLAGRQWGVVNSTQLQRLGLSGSTIGRRVAEGRLHRKYPGVYAVGHPFLSIEGRLVAALFYAGPGAALSHTTAAWWLDIWGSEPRRIHVSAKGKRVSLGEVVVHPRRDSPRDWHRRLPVTTVEQTFLDLATMLSLDDLRWALAEAEYRKLLDVDALEAIRGRGRPGSHALGLALAAHRPELAHTRSKLERSFLALCERFAIEIPEMNVWIAGFRVDAVWRGARVVVELDGEAAHAAPARMEQDRRRDLALRAAGFVVLRYTWRQITRQPELVATDLRTALSRR